jgi:hypothetical protein
MTCNGHVKSTEWLGTMAESSCHSEPASKCHPYHLSYQRDVGAGVCEDYDALKTRRKAAQRKFLLEVVMYSVAASVLIAGAVAIGESTE